MPVPGSVRPIQSASLPLVAVVRTAPDGEPPPGPASRIGGRSGRVLSLVRGLPPLPTATFLIVTFAFMPKALLGMGLYAPLDILSQASPWRDAVPSTPHVAEVIQNDFVQSIPLLEAMVNALRHGHWLMWSPYIAGGEPVGALVTIGFQSPFNLLLVVLPTLWGLAAVTALRLLFSQVFFYLFLRRLSISTPIATFGAVAYTFCGSNVALLGRINAYLILPMILWATVRVLQRRRPGDVALLAVASALAWLAGFPGGFVNGLVIDGLLALFLAVSPAVRPASARRWLGSVTSGLALVACGVALSAGLVAVSLLPSQKLVSTSGLEQARLYNSSSHLATEVLPSEFSVGALGSWHDAGVFVHRLPDGTVAPAGNSVELESGAGMVVVIAALAGILLTIAGRVSFTRLQRSAFLFGLVSVIGGLVLIYFKTPLLGLFYDLPLLGTSPANRFRIIIDIGFVLVACLGIEGYRAALQARAAADETAPTGDAIPPETERPRACLPERIGGVLALLALLYLVERVWGDYVGWLDSPLGATVEPKLILEIVGAIGVFALVLGGLRWTIRRPARRQIVWSGTGLLLALTTFATTGFTVRYFSPTVSKRWLLPRTAGQAELARLAGQRYRILGSGLGTFYSDTSIYYGFLDLRGLSISNPSFRKLVVSAIPNAYALDQFKVIYTPPSDPINFASPALDDLGVRYYVGGTNEQPFAASRKTKPPVSSRLVAPGLSASRTIPTDRGLTGVEIPVALGSGASCDGSRLQVTISTTSGRRLATALRPAIDAPPGNLVPGAFTIPVASVADQRRVRVEITIVSSLARPGRAAPCRVSVGLDRGGRLDVGQLIRRPGQMAIVADDQAVFYQRPHAHPVVWTTGNWRPAPTTAQALALATSPRRRWSDPVPVAGARQPSHASGGEVQRIQYVSDGFDVRSHTDGSELIATGFAGDAKNWSVDVDGHPAKLASVDGALLGTVVGPGEHMESFRYEPPGFKEGAVISGLSVLILIGLIAIERRG